MSVTHKRNTVYYGETQTNLKLPEYWPQTYGGLKLLQSHVNTDADKFQAVFFSSYCFHRRNNNKQKAFFTVGLFPFLSSKSTSVTIIENSPALFKSLQCDREPP